jgi:hypothetical protein
MIAKEHVWFEHEVTKIQMHELEKQGDNLTVSIGTLKVINIISSMETLTVSVGTLQSL